MHILIFFPGQSTVIISEHQGVGFVTGARYPSSYHFLDTIGNGWHLVYWVWSKTGLDWVDIWVELDVHWITNVAWSMEHIVVFVPQHCFIEWFILDSVDFICS